jgi:hypothetical protein
MFLSYFWYAAICIFLVCRSLVCVRAGLKHQYKENLRSTHSAYLVLFDLIILITSIFGKKL